MAKKKTTSKKSTKKQETKKSSSKKSAKKSSSKKTKIPRFKYQDKREIAMDFASSVHSKFKEMIKSTILFGSESTKTSSSKSDIDIMIIIDDASIKWDLELVAWYREELGKIIASKDYSQELHINTIKLTTWWYDLMHGDAVVLNILRYGQPLIDLGGFFTPLKALLLQGKIHSTPEAVYAALQRAPIHLARSKQAEAGSIEGVYWTMVDSAQAALITVGKLPPSPEHLPKMLKENFVDTKMLPMEYVNWYREIFTMHKGITHGEIRDIKGTDLDAWQEKAEKFMLKMTDIIDNLLESSSKK